MDFVTFSLALIALAYIIQWVFNKTGTGAYCHPDPRHVEHLLQRGLVEVFPAPPSSAAT